MGGCCCCASGGNAPTNPPTFHYPLGGHTPLSSQQGGPAAAFGGRLVDTNLDTSIPDTFRAPPAPMPYDVVIGRPVSPPVTEGVGDDKNGGGGGAVAAQATTDANSGGNQDQRIHQDQDQDEDQDEDQDQVQVQVQDPSVKCGDVKESECKEQTQLEDDAKKKSEIETSKPMKSGVVPIEEEEDVCPICLEDYNTENPKLITKCEHHFHLACVLEWMERSETCPVCDQEMVIDPPTNS